MSAHAMLAALTTVKELELSEDEARKLSTAAQEVAKQYQYFLTDKQIAWLNLTAVAGGVYGTRFVAWGIRRGSERAAKRPAPPAPGAPPSSPVNGHAAQRAEINLTPDFMTVPPEGEVVP